MLRLYIGNFNPRIASIQTEG